MGTKNVFFTARNTARAGLCVLALGGVSLTAVGQPIDQYYPSGRNAFDAMSRMAAGSSTQYGMHLTGSGVTGGIPVSPQNLSGWTRAGNYGMAPTAVGGTYSIGGKFNETIAGRTVPLTATAQVTKAGVLLGVGKLLPIIGNAIAIGQLLDGMKDAMDAAEVEKNTGPDAEQNPFKWRGDAYEYRDENYGGNEWQGSPTAAAEAGFTKWGQTAYPSGIPERKPCTVVDVGGGQIASSCTFTGAGGPGSFGNLIGKRLVVGGAPMMSGNWDQARPKFESADFPLGPLVQAQLDALDRAKKNGIDGGSWNIPTTAPTVSGPSSLPQTKKTETRTWNETGPDGITRQKTETKETTTNTPLSYEKDTVKAVPTDTTVTTTTTKNPDGSTTTETGTETKTEESTKPEEEKSDFCVEHPDVLACATPELDTPEGEIPKDTKTITYQEENLFGSGSCPADIVANVASLHRSLKLWDWQKTCSMALPLRALVVALAGFAAFLIVMPGSPRV